MLATHAQPETSHAPPVRRCACGGIVGPTGECAACRAKRLAREAKTRSAGAPLEARTRSAMERSFGHDFSSVRVHADAPATAGIGARAFTVGSNIVANSKTQMSFGLLAHELAHVVQQRGASMTDIAHRASPGAEAEASRAASSVAEGRSAGALSSQPSAIARQDLDAGTTGDTGTSGGGQERSAEWARQLNCVIRLGGCPNSRPGGIPSPEEIAGYNTECRKESTYTGSDVTPTDEECGTPTPPGTPPPPPVTTMICSKRLDAPVLGWFANHAYIDDTGKGDCKTGKSMVGNYAVQRIISGNGINGCAVKTDTSDDPQSYTPNAKPCNPAPGVTDVHACLRAAFNAYADPSVYSNDPRNKPWGPNSNTFAATLARACCADSTDSGLGSVPGWYHAPATPCERPGGAASNETVAQEGSSSS